AHIDASHNHPAYEVIDSGNPPDLDMAAEQMPSQKFIHSRRGLKLISHYKKDVARIPKNKTGDRRSALPVCANEGTRLNEVSSPMVTPSQTSARAGPRHSTRWMRRDCHSLSARSASTRQRKHHDSHQARHYRHRGKPQLR